MFDSSTSRFGRTLRDRATQEIDKLKQIADHSAANTVNNFFGFMAKVAEIRLGLFILQFVDWAGGDDTTRECLYRHNLL